MKKYIIEYIDSIGERKTLEVAADDPESAENKASEILRTKESGFFIQRITEKK